MQSRRNLVECSCVFFPVKLEDAKRSAVVAHSLGSRSRLTDFCGESAPESETKRQWRFDVVPCVDHATAMMLRNYSVRADHIEWVRARQTLPCNAQWLCTVVPAVCQSDLCQRSAVRVLLRDKALLAYSAGLVLLHVVRVRSCLLREVCEVESVGSASRNCSANSGRHSLLTHKYSSYFTLRKTSFFGLADRQAHLSGTRSIFMSAGGGKCDGASPVMTCSRW